MKPANLIRTDVVEGWPLAVVQGDRREEARLGHFEVARRFDYSAPEKVMKLARRIWGKTFSPPWAESPSAGGRPRREYFFTRSQVLKLAARSDMPVAETILDEMIDVFEAWLDGRLAMAGEDVRRKLADVERRLALAERTSGCIPGIVADWIMGRVDVLAEMRMQTGRSTTKASARMKMLNVVKTAARWGNAGELLRDMPAASLPFVRRALRNEELDMKRALREQKKKAPPIAKPRQVEMYDISDRKAS